MNLLMSALMRNCYEVEEEVSEAKPQRCKVTPQRGRGDTKCARPFVFEAKGEEILF